MFDFFLTSETGVGLLMGLIAVTGGLLIGLVAVIGGLINEHRRLEVEAGLKQQMLERGMSAEEIQQVLQASIGAKRSRRCGS
jgi:hypothetical protein